MKTKFSFGNLRFYLLLPFLYRIEAKISIYNTHNTSATYFVTPRMKNRYAIDLTL